MTARPSPAQLMALLQQKGYCVLRDAAGERLLNRTRACVDKALAETDPQRLAWARAPGSLINSDNYPELADLIGNRRALAQLDRMGLEEIRFWKAVIISKPPGGPRLYWHQDCLMWQDRRAYGDRPPMIFLMYYLEDTTRANGCLRLLPGTHRRRHLLHDLGEAHTRAINRMDDPDDPRFLDYPGEVDVPVRAGDVVVGDARMFHAAHANRSAEKRTVITIWFHPFFSDLEEPTQSWIHDRMHSQHAGWPPEALAKIQPLIPRYRGSAAPMEQNRQPDERLPRPRGAAA